MKLLRWCGGFVIAIFIAMLCPAALAADLSDPAIYEKQITPLLQKYCYQCHGNGKTKGDLALDSFKTREAVLKSRQTWELVLKNVRVGDMPPDEAKAKPSQAERDQIINWIESQFHQIDPKNPDPGRVTIRRLNRAEYDNTIRDLVGVNFQPAIDFPPDDSGYGFDNIGDVLSLPPVLMEKYLAAADKILDEAIPTEPIKSVTRRIPASLGQIGFNAIGDRGDGWVQLISLEDDDVAVELPTSPGDYIVRVHAFCKPTGGISVGGGNNRRVAATGPTDPNRISIFVNNAFIQDFELATDEASAGTYEARVSVGAGKNRFRAVMARIRGGANELIMVNGRLGRQQPGIAFVKWIEIEGPLPVATHRYRAAELESVGEGKNLPSGTRLLDHEGEVAVKFRAPKDGEYVLRAQAYANQAGDQLAKMQFRVDGKPINDFDVIAPATMKQVQGQRLFSPALLLQVPHVYELKLNLTAGEHSYSAAFINDFVDPENKNPNLVDRNLYVDFLEVADASSPALQPEMPAQIKQLLASQAAVTNKSLAARNILAQFARHAFRRPVESNDLDRLMSLFDLADKDGQCFEASIKLAMKGVLISPFFLFRGEIQPNPNDPKSVHQVNEFALASRLSYFLWSSMPDDELLSLAERGELRKNLDAQVKRMLASEKSQSLVDNFASQWLQTRSLPGMQFDRDQFPSYDPGLTSAMQKETETFFEHVMREDRSVLDFLTGDYTFVNERLARLYNIENVKGEEFQRVSLDGTPRRGVLTQASVLALTSNPTRTSPVKRGKWVLENLLGTPPPPPPPDVPPLEKDGHKATGTLRQQMEQHRVDPNCAGCHARMDPIGFGLENFDAIGAWRDKDGEGEIDASGVLTTGENFKGAVELINILAEQKRGDFVHCLTEKVLTYALGRGVLRQACRRSDRPGVGKGRL
jgi:mono/diheme cytochrome c family protein